MMHPRHAKLQAAYDRVDAAKKAYSDAVRAEFPIESWVELQHGDKWIGPYVVRGHGPHYSRPTELILWNPHTEKTRWASCISVRHYGEIPQSSGEDERG